MQAAQGIGMFSLALAILAGCQQQQQHATVGSPSTPEMHQALVNMMKSRQDIPIPEFRISLENDVPVTRDGIVYFGSWNCDPRLMTFDAVFTGSNYTMYEVYGNFEKDARGVWMAVPYPPVIVQRRDIGEIWRANEMQPRPH